MFKTDLFKGKRFLITGGGTGIGRMILEEYVELGADCVICGRRGGVLEETAKQVMEGEMPHRRVGIAVGAGGEARRLAPAHPRQQQRGREERAERRSERCKDAWLEGHSLHQAAPVASERFSVSNSCRQPR